MIDLILVFTIMIGYLTYLLTCCNRLLQRHHSFQGWDRSSSTRPLVEDAQTIDLCMIERGYHVFRLAFSSFPVQCAYCTRRCIQLPNLRLPPALVLIVYLKIKKDFAKNAENFSTKALAINVVLFALWWSALTYDRLKLLRFDLLTILCW